MSRQHQLCCTKLRYACIMLSGSPHVSLHHGDLHHRAPAVDCSLMGLQASSKLALALALAKVSQVAYVPGVPAAAAWVQDAPALLAPLPTSMGSPVVSAPNISQSPGWYMPGSA